MSHNDIIDQVPPNYYQEGVKHNLLQRLWHTNKLHEVNTVISKCVNTPQRILDVGCASGWFLSRIAHMHPKASCYGIDIYDKAIQYGKKRYPKLHLRIGDAHKIPYKSQFFDTVVCTEVLEHVDTPSEVLKEIKRALKKKGIAVIELDSGSILFSIVWYIWRKYAGKVWNDSHLHSFTPQKLERAIRKAGFSLISKKTFNVGMAMIFVIQK